MNFIFDLGGVLLRWRPATLLAQVLPQHASTPEAATRLARDFFGGPGGEWHDFDLGLATPDEVARRIAARLPLAAAEVLRVIAAVPAELEAIEPTVAWLARLRAAGHRLFYLSNMAAPVAEHVEHAHSFFAQFDDGVFSARVRLAKPDAAIFHHALARFGIEAPGSVFLDDHAPNVESARALGMRAVLFRDAAQAESELRVAGIG